MVRLIEKSVLLLKTDSESNENRYKIILENEGYKVLQATTLIFNYVNVDALKGCLEKPDEFSGIVFTSPRCVSATKWALDGNHLDAKWLEKCNYCVGKSTANFALEQLNIVCSGEQTNTASNLANYINKERNQFDDKPLLYPHGTITLAILSTNVKRLHSICAYESLENPKLLQEMQSLFDNFNCCPQNIVYFSPSGVHSSSCFLDKFPLDEIKFWAIGETTHQAMLKNGLKVAGVAKQPSPEGILEMLKL